MNEGQKVSDYVADFLADRGIRHVFGIIGAGNVRIFEAIAARGYTDEEFLILPEATEYGGTGSTIEMYARPPPPKSAGI